MFTYSGIVNYATMDIEELKALLDEFDLGVISLGYEEMDCLSSTNFQEGQVGYSVGENGEDFTGQSEGDWRASWFVIASENADPYFIDVDSGIIYSAAHGEGDWSPQMVANNYAQFAAIIKRIETLSVNRTSPIELENNPITDSERGAFKAFVEEELGLDFGRWEAWVEEA